MILAFAADDNYAMQVAVAANSALSNCGQTEGTTLYLLDCGISEANRRKIEQSLPFPGLKIRFITVDPATLQTMRAYGHVTVAMYARLFLPDLLPSEVTRVLYLDADTVVLGDVHELWNAPLGKWHALAALDPVVPTVSSRWGLQNYAELGLRADTPYFNSGVMLLDLEKWRADGTGRRVYEYLRANEKIISLGDQDGLNALLHDKWGRIDPAWNVFAKEYSGRPAWENVKLWHYCAPKKPWRPGFAHPSRRFFYRYVDRTQWAGWRLGFRAELTSRIASSSFVAAFRRVKSLLGSIPAIRRARDAFRASADPR